MIAQIQNIVATLSNNSALATLMGTTIPNKSIYTGDADVVREQQSTFQYPLLVLHTISDAFERMPLNAKETVIQLDVYSRTSEMEAINIYEEIANILTYSNAIQGGTKIWWQRTTDAHDQSETEQRIFHIPVTLKCWSYDNSPE